MSLVSDIINQAFSHLGVTKPGEAVSTTIQSASFLLLQEMWSSWSTEEAMAYLFQHQTFSLGSGTQYTLGVGGSLSTSARPVRVTGWTSFSGNFRNGGRIIDFQALHEIAKNSTGKRSVLAEAVAADSAFPLINIEVFPPPDTSPGSLILDYWTPLVPFVAVTDVLALPDGWELALSSNLALVLAPQYARIGGVPDTLAALAANSKASIAAKNAAALGLNAAPPAQG